MPRDTALLYPAQPLAPALPAATLLLLRDGPAGPEVLLTRRSMQASFAPGAHVFPGGRVEAADHALARHTCAAPGGIPTHGTSAPIPRVIRRPSQGPQLLASVLAAIRESFEELGVLLGQHSGGAWVSQPGIDALQRHRPLYAQLAQAGICIAADQVLVLARWITDRASPKRFDTPFLLARMPPGQTPVADEIEQFAPEWLRPRDALQRHAEGRFCMIFPTVRTLEWLAAHTSVDAILAAAAPAPAPEQTESSLGLWASCPRMGRMHGHEARIMEHEAAFGELAMVAPYGQCGHDLHWQHQHPVPLLKHLMRLTAPNPSRMTGPGTNTYLLGTPHTGIMVIDPGPQMDAHIQRILHATGGDIVAIVCTHSHADHSPAAAPLQALVRQAFPGRACPILGCPSADTAQPSAHFRPDVHLIDGQRLGAYFRHSGHPDALATDPLVVATPGHAANHLCLILPGDGLLFSGDHILNGSTTVIDPPDGNMTDYLTSLDRLQTLCAQHDLRFIAPAHGHILSQCAAAQAPPDTPGDARSDTVGGAVRVIAALRAHRLRRQARVLQAMRAHPGAGLHDWLPLAYGDIDPELWPIASRSLAAHVARIQALQLIALQDDRAPPQA